MAHLDSPSTEFNMEALLAESTNHELPAFCSNHLDNDVQPYELEDWEDATVQQFGEALNTLDDAMVRVKIDELARVEGGKFLTPFLFEGYCRGKMNAVKELLERGAEPTYNLIETAVKDANVQALELFLQHGWDINKALTDQRPPALSVALYSIDLVKWFLAHGAKPNQRCAMLNLTPLSEAVHTATLEIVTLLLDVDEWQERGELLHHAVLRTAPDYMHLLEILISRGARVNKIMYEDDLVAYKYQEMLGLGTPLHGAARLGKIDIIKLLVQHGADPNIRDSCGRLPEELAQIHKRSEAYEFIKALRAGMDTTISDD